MNADRDIHAVGILLSVTGFLNYSKSLEVMRDDNQPERNTKPYAPRYTQAVKQEVVDSIIQGELFLEEAMIKYEIVDRRTVIHWLRKYLREEKRNNN